MPDPGNPEGEKIDYNTEYLERFARAKAEAEAKGMKYIYPPRAGIGWKIHLAVSDSPQDSLTSKIAKYLESKRLLFKIGNGGTTEDGKGMTVYLGDRDTMEDFADELNEVFGADIPEQQGEALTSDMPITGNVWARFDNYRDPQANPRSDKYHQYGPRGVPNLLEDTINMAPWSNALPTEERRERSVAALTEDYGAFFTGTRGEPV